jgi:phosphatidylserine decarboxylase
VCDLISVRKEVLPFLYGALALGGCLALLATALDHGQWVLLVAVITLVLAGYLLYFFRDPPRVTPDDAALVFAPADGVIARIEVVDESEHLRYRAVRVSTFLSLMDVHVNRIPMAGTVRHTSYHPGKRYFTFQDKSSDFNQHSAIVVDGPEWPYLIHQIVGPVARRVVYWLKVSDQVGAGQDFGLMKFGSRLDLFLPEDKVEILVSKGDRVRAGETPIARRVSE